MDQTVLRQVRKAIRTGKLPARDPRCVTGRLIGGLGSEGSCSLCGKRLMPLELELELEFAPGKGHARSMTRRVHPRCYAVWMQEREARVWMQRLLRPSPIAGQFGRDVDSGIPGTH